MLIFLYGILMSMIVNVLTNHDRDCVCNKNNNLCGPKLGTNGCACPYIGYHPNPKPVPCKINADVIIARNFLFCLKLLSIIFKETRQTWFYGNIKILISFFPLLKF